MFNLFKKVEKVSTDEAETGGLVDSGSAPEKFSFTNFTSKLKTKLEANTKDLKHRIDEGAEKLKEKLKANQPSGCQRFPWTVVDEGATEDTKMDVKRLINMLPEERSNFTVGPPHGEIFDFDLDTVMPMAQATLVESEALNHVRFRLVPRKIKEGPFWRNYFWRVNMIRKELGVSPVNFDEPSTKCIDDTVPAAAESGVPADAAVMNATVPDSREETLFDASEATATAAEGRVSSPSANKTKASSAAEDAPDDPLEEFASNDFMNNSGMDDETFQQKLREELGISDDGGGDTPSKEMDLGDMKDLNDFEQSLDDIMDQIQGTTTSDDPVALESS